MGARAFDYLLKWGWDIIFFFRLNKLLIKLPGMRKYICQQELIRGGITYNPASFVECASAGRLPEVRLFTCAGIRVNVPGQGGNTALHLAAGHGHREVVEHLLSQPEIDPRARNEDKDTALILAAREGEREVVESLLGHDPQSADLDNKLGDTALIVAARENQGKIVARLLEENVNVNARNKADESALLEAARREYAGIVQELKDHGAQEVDLEKKVARWQLEQDGIYTGPDFIHAVEQDKAKLVKKFLVAGMDPNTRDVSTDPAMIVAVRRGYMDIVECLLAQAGIEANLANGAGDTPLIIAVRQDHAAIVTALLTKLTPEQVNARNRLLESALLEAARHEYADIVQQLQHKEAYEPDLAQKVARWQLEQMGIFNVPGFLRCVERGDMELVQKFLVAGMDANARDERGDTALIVAARGNRGQIVLSLLERHALDVHVRNADGESALLEAARRGHEDIVQTLQRCGASEPDLEQKVARWQLEQMGIYTEPDFFRAIEKGDAPLVQKFLAAGMNPHLRDEHQNSLLLEAAWRGYDEIVRLLQDRGAQEPDLERKIARRQLEHAGVYGEAHFIRAVAGGEVELAAKYILAGMSANTLDERREPALLVAVRHRQPEIVRLLLAQKGQIKVNLPNAEGLTAIELASARNDTELVDLLREAGAKLDPQKAALRRLKEIGLPFREDVFIALARKGDEKLAALFLEAGMQPNAENEQGDTALMEAARNGHRQLVDLLIQRGAEVNLRNRFHVSALEAAERNGYTEVATLLRKHEALPSDPSRESLLEAVENGDLAGVEAALDTGITPDVYTEDGEPLLMVAARQGQAQIATLLLQKGATVDVRDREDRTALMCAAELGKTETIPLLLKAGAELDATDGQGSTPLLLATWNGQAWAVRLLIEAGADLHARDKSGRSVQMIAQHKGHPEIVEILREAGVAEQSPEADLLAAAARGDSQAVEALVEAGADPQIPDEAGNTALALAAARGWIQVIEALQPDQRLIEKANEAGDTAFMLAARSGHLEIVELFLERGVNIDAVNKNSETALLQAAMAGKGAVVEFLAKKGADPDLAASGTTPLLECCYHGQLDAVGTLLDKGADANQELEYGFSALMTAMILGHADIVKELKDRKVRLGDLEGQVFLDTLDGNDEDLKKLDLDAADLNARDREGWTALMIAAREGFDSIVKTLLAKNARTDVKSRDGQTTALLEAARHGRTGVLQRLLPKTELDADAATGALIEAAAQGHAEVIRLLADQAHACVDGRAKGRVPLIEAAAKGHISAVQVLLELKADKEKRSRDGLTAMMVARLNDHMEIVELLAGSDPQGLKEARLLLAASDGNEAEVERLLSPPNPARINARDNEGRTALMRACEKGHLAVVDVLFAHMNEDRKKAAANDHDHRGRTPLMLAARGGDVQIVRTLLALKVSIQAESGSKRTALMEACKLGRFEIVKMLIDAMELDSRRVAVNHQDKDGNSPLSEAYQQEERWRGESYREIIVRLEKEGATVGREAAEFLSAVRGCNSARVSALIDHLDFKKLRLQGRTPLMLCAESGCVSVAEILIRKGVDVNEADQQGYTALMLAVMAKRREMVQLLLKSGADPDRLDSRESNALIKAVEKEDPGTVGDLLAARANVNHRDRDGDTALLVAVRKNNASLVQLLLSGERLLNLDGLDKDRRTALALAHLRGSYRRLCEKDSPAFDALLSGVADPRLTGIESLLLGAGARKGWDEAELIHAVQKPDLGFMQTLIADGVDVNMRDLSGSTGLLLACRKEDLEVAGLLIDHGASVTIRNEEDRTPCMEAAKQKEKGLELVKRLYQVDPTLDLNAQDKQGETALLEAARAGQAETVQFLVEVGANVKATNRKGESPIIEMAKYSCVEAVRSLLKHGANACAQDASHTTAILEAAKHGDLATLTLLLECLKDRLKGDERKRLIVVNAIDPEACTAVDWAAKGSYEECVRLLRRHGGTAAVESDLVVYTTPTGDHYHCYDCSRISYAREHHHLTKRPLWSATVNYDFCDVCAPSFAATDWSC